MKPSVVIQGDNAPRLLLHVCCGPCATAVIERLRPRFEVHCFWYNPNIQPETEYQRRLTSMRVVAEVMDVPLIEAQEDTAGWLQAVAGLEDEPEGGRRCQVCFEYRLERAVRYAHAHSFSYLATTLVISPHKDLALINALGTRLADASGATFLTDNFREQGGFQRSVQLSKGLNLYRQSYCGCLFSRSSSPIVAFRRQDAHHQGC